MIFVSIIGSLCRSVSASFQQREGNTAIHYLGAAWSVLEGQRSAISAASFDSASLQWRWGGCATVQRAASRCCSCQLFVHSTWTWPPVSVTGRLPPPTTPSKPLQSVCLSFQHLFFAVRCGVTDTMWDEFSTPRPNLTSITMFPLNYFHI